MSKAIILSIIARLEDGLLPAAPTSKADPRPALEARAWACVPATTKTVVAGDRQLIIAKQLVSLKAATDEQLLSLVAIFDRQFIEASVADANTKFNQLVAAPDIRSTALAAVTDKVTGDGIAWNQAGDAIYWRSAPAGFAHAFAVEPVKTTMAAFKLEPGVLDGIDAVNLQLLADQTGTSVRALRSMNLSRDHKVLADLALRVINVVSVFELAGERAATMTELSAAVEGLRASKEFSIETEPDLMNQNPDGIAAYEVWDTAANKKVEKFPSYEEAEAYITEQGGRVGIGPLSRKIVSFKADLVTEEERESMGNDERIAFVMKHGTAADKNRLKNDPDQLEDVFNGLWGKVRAAAVTKVFDDKGEQAKQPGDNEHHSQLLDDDKRAAVVIDVEPETDPLKVKQTLYTAKEVSLADLQKNQGKYALAQWCVDMEDARKKAKYLELRRADYQPLPDRWVPPAGEAAGAGVEDVKDEMNGGKRMKVKEIKVAYSPQAIEKTDKIPTAGEQVQKLRQGNVMAGDLRSVRVTFDDGNVINTNMAAGISDEEIKAYYAVGNEFNVGSGADDKMAKVAKVEILAGLKAANYKRGYERHNDKMDKIWKKARALEKERLARGEKPNPNLTEVDENGNAVKEGTKVKAASQCTVSFKKKDNTKGPQDDEVEATVKPPAEQVGKVLEAAGFKKVGNGVYAIYQVDQWAAMDQFKKALAKSDAGSVVEEADNTLVLDSGAPVTAGRRIAGILVKPRVRAGGIQKGGDHPQATHIDWTETPQALTITINEAYKQELREMLDAGKSNDALSDVAELLGQDGIDWIRPEEIGALTDAPIFGRVERNDQGEITSADLVWWYPNYAVTDPIQELVDNGKVVFDGAPENIKEEVKAGLTAAPKPDKKKDKKADKKEPEAEKKAEKAEKKADADLDKAEAKAEEPTVADAIKPKKVGGDLGPMLDKALGKPEGTFDQEVKEDMANGDDFTERARKALATELGADPEDLDDAQTYYPNDEVESVGFEHSKNEYVVFADEDEAIKAAEESVRNDFGPNGEGPDLFNKDFLMAHVDREALKSYMEQVFDEWVRNDVSELSTSEKEEWLKEKGLLEDKADGSDYEESEVEALFDSNEEAWVEEYVSDRLGSDGGQSWWEQNMGEEDFRKIIKDNGFIDVEALVEEAVSVDGPGHFLSSYDGAVHDLPGGMVYIRTN